MKVLRVHSCPSSDHPEAPCGARYRAHPHRGLREGTIFKCSVLTLAPHCHGTHTETVGHVTVGGPDLARLTPVPPALGLLLSVEPVPPGGGATARSPALAGDRVVTPEVNAISSVLLAISIIFVAFFFYLTGRKT